MRNLTFILCTFYLIPAFALEDEEIRYYDIELIVYENKETESEATEVWKKATSLVVPENSITLGRPLTLKLDPKYDPLISFKLLSSAELRLKEELNSLKAAEQYRVLLHTGWRQPGMPRDKAISVYFNHAITESDESESAETPFNPVATTAGPNQAVTAEQQAVPETSEPLDNLQGNITIVLSRYLHTDIELVYKKAADTSTVDRFDSDYLESREGKDAVYYLKQNRRMRSQELHYIDHPVLGVLIKIMQHKIEKPVVPEKSKPAAIRAN